MLTTLVRALALLAPILSVQGQSCIKGKAFDRLAIIWLENTDYELAAGDPNLAWLAKKGISLSNYFAVTHPSMPNYAAAISGDYYGINHDDKIAVPSNVSTLIDLLEDKGVSWAEYQEDMPSVGFAGNYPNPKTGANMYVRKHNPAVLYDSVALKQDRLARIKPLSAFNDDLSKGQLPQWMFITPNMTSDGHDTTVTVAGTWTRKFLEPLLTNKAFMNNTLVMVTFDENHSYAKQNRIVGMLLGDAVPANLVGTTDTSFYNHYSAIATVQANWGLHTLGRWDVGANVFKFVAAKTGDTVRAWSGKVPLSSMFFNASYAGKLNNIDNNVAWPVPNSDVVYAGRTVLPAVKATWGKQVGQSKYTAALEIPDGMHPDTEFN
ncbi:phosphoesterase-domain-containing protein [Clathrospora elynae]|uniref:Phosphoesterase-domain-containing protein n=1 Tax=Clathrospora elynae TaxID=706981 RepID=A0A6A5SCJ7_9PLEO|nr:phosphoesterase-domain-containing protein [Clathrospora elynae]